MVRLACISLPKIDLQIVALRHPEWKKLPAVVVTEEKPLGKVTAANKLAYAAGVQPGMRYASALSICPELRAGVVVPEERDALRERLVDLLRKYTPSIEPARDDHALFWVNAAGLERVHGTPNDWANKVRDAIEREELVCSIAVGFTRFGTYAAAKVKRQITIFALEDEETNASLRAPLGVLPFDHEILLRLHHLAIHTVRDFVRFSAGSLRRRFGAEVEAIQRFAKGEEDLPIQAVDETRLLRREMRLLYPEGSMDAVLHHQLSLLRELVSQAWSEQQLVSEIVMEFCPEQWPGSREECMREEIRTAKPTIDQRKLERLLHLRLENITLPGPIVRLALEIVVLPTERAQDDLFAAPMRRDPSKALAALTEITAELGNDAVQVASLVNAHLPEDQYSWQRITRLVPPRPLEETADPEFADEASGLDDAEGEETVTPLIRRILCEPQPLARIPDEFSYPRMVGPYELSGGWWAQRGPAPQGRPFESGDSAVRNLHSDDNARRAEHGSPGPDPLGHPSEPGVRGRELHNDPNAEAQPSESDAEQHDLFDADATVDYEAAYRREYYYLQDRSGRILWVYYDAGAGSWNLQGVVE